MLGFIANLFSSNDSNQSGTDILGDAGAIVEAVTERTDMGYEVQITLGDPQLVDRGNFTQDLYVEIPTSTENGPDPADLEYDLPDGIEDAEAELFELLDVFGIDTVADLDQLAGQTVPGEMMLGHPVPDFAALVDGDSEE